MQFEPEHEKKTTTKWQRSASSKDLDQPGHLPSLITVYALHLMSSQGPKASSSGQRRLVWLGRCPGWSMDYSSLKIWWEKKSHGAEVSERVSRSSERFSFNVYFFHIMVRIFFPIGHFLWDFLQKIEQISHSLPQKLSLWSETSLGAQVILLDLSCADSYNVQNGKYMS